MKNESNFIKTSVCLASIFAIVFTFNYSSLNGQEKVLTAGIQIKPLVPNPLFRSTTINTLQNNINTTISQKIGFSGGMVVRKGLTNMWSLESGINIAIRKYRLDITDQHTQKNYENNFSITAYEIPLLALLYVRLSDKVYMNTALGASLDFYPSSVGVFDFDYDFIGARKSWIQGAMLANHGYEYRTKEHGYFYFGASFHQPFNNIYRYQTKIESNTVEDELDGIYFTIDLRYFFHEKPENKN